jgi:NAD(P)-dependent dehydrogenase (short-subunit alcohol dehydrogenase family)
LAHGLWKLLRKQTTAWSRWRATPSPWNKSVQAWAHRRNVASFGQLTSQIQSKKAFLRVRNELGPVNLLICNAGGGAKRGSFLDITPQEFLKNLHGQALGPFLCAKEAIPDMLTHGGGTIAYIGATSSVKGYAKSSAFATANSRCVH